MDTSFQPFDFSVDYILEDDVVRLEPLAAFHHDHLLPYSLNEPELWRYSGPGTGADGEENLGTYLRHALAQRGRLLEYPFAVFDKRTQTYAGSTRFYDFNLADKRLELGYTWYGRDFQRTGLNRHCKFLLLQFAFEKTGIQRVGFSAHSGNEKSIRAMKAIGCREEGILRSFRPSHSGLRADCIKLSILSDEWPAVKENLSNHIYARS
jgi:RimJ/RimL family protein N-acetyltransferase